VLAQWQARLVSKVGRQLDLEMLEETSQSQWD
jgi:hypothetical protein